MLPIVEALTKRNLILRITGYAVERNSDFVYSDMKDALKLTDDDDRYILRVLTYHSSSTSNPNHILQLERQHTTGETQLSNQLQSTYTLLPQALYNYIDYIEIVEARNTAKEARIYALLSMRIAIWSMVFSVFIGLVGIIVQLLSN